ncbi:uncharacterized protein [Antennarius striatus]|uniref:uncharacterized protein isoform X2 n=1 Tax=Antennarius striatus TaxID=241820 RepID=UPI0035B0F07E
MVPRVLLLLLLGLCSASSTDNERGRTALRRVRNLAAQPRYGECWVRVLEQLDTRCRELTADSQSRIAVRFTQCHLNSSGRDFPSCPEGSEVSRCTAGMDAVAFNAYTEFFTHTHSICHFLQSEAWQSSADSTMYRLTESSAGVAEQLESTRQMAEELVEAQSAALQAQQEILNNGEELRVTLRDSTQGLREVFSELRSVSREQQVALSELFNRVSFLQSFLLTEAHSLSSICYNGAALCTAYLLTSTQRSSRARLLLLVLVCVNFYLEMKIYQFVMKSDHPEHTHMELVSAYVSVLRWFMVCVGVCVLLCVCVHYTDPMQQNLQLLRQLQETQKSLQAVVQQAVSSGQQQKESNIQLKRTSESRRRQEILRRRMVVKDEEEEEEYTTFKSPTSDLSELSQPSHTGLYTSHPSHMGLCPSHPSHRVRTCLTCFCLCTDCLSLAGCYTISTVSSRLESSQNPPEALDRPSRRSSSSPLVYSILVENKRPRYSLRSRRSETH